jgi:hypothetical protein
VASCYSLLFKYDFILCRVSIPLILSLPATVLSLTKKDALKVCCCVHAKHFVCLCTRACQLMGFSGYHAWPLLFYSSCFLNVFWIFWTLQKL